MKLERTFDPHTLRPVYADDAEVCARIAQVGERLSHIKSNPATFDAHEFELHEELIDLHLWLGERYAAIFAEFAMRVRLFMVKSRPLRFLAHVRRADFLVWDGQYARATMLFIDLVERADKQSRAVRAVTLLRAGRCDYVQGMWREARDNFTYALGFGAKARLAEPFFVEAEFALRCATNRLRSSAA